MSKGKKTYWFKRRRYGYGWVPSTWQGWLLIIALAASIGGGAFFLRHAARHTLSKESIAYIIFVLVDVTIFFLIALKKGPSPKWRWGRKDNDNPDEDF